jgi:single-strand DNA-binding protein
MRVMVVGRLQQRSWDDQEGNKRSAFEIQVDEVGPSLRWATATVQKSSRSGGRGGEASGPQGGGGGEWNKGAPVGGSPQYGDEGGF